MSVAGLSSDKLTCVGALYISYPGKLVKTPGLLLKSPPDIDTLI